MALLQKNIKTLRKRMHLSQEQLAVRVGSTRPNIGAYEEGRVKQPPLEVMFSMAQVFGVTFDQLLNEDFENAAPNTQALQQLSLHESLDNTPHQKEDERPIADFYDIPQTIDIKTNSLHNLQKNNSNSSTELDSKICYYISQQNIVRYIQNNNHRLFLEQCPKLNLAHIMPPNAFAFDAPADFPLTNAVVICEKVADNQTLEDRQHYIILCHNGSMYFRVVFDFVHEADRYLLGSVNPAISSLDLDKSQVHSVYKYHSYLSSQLPKYQNISPKILRLFKELNGELNKLEE